MRTSLLQAAILTATVMTSCSDGVTGSDADSTPAAIMAVQTRAEITPGSELQPRLLFWRYSQLDSIAEEDPVPYYENTPNGVIDDYKETKYNTGRYYPERNEAVLAVGFAPSTLPSSIPGKHDIYGIPNGNGTDSTVMVSNSVIGTGRSVISQPLVFRPATVRFVFKGIRDEDAMAQPGKIMYVRDVTITFKVENTPNCLRWDADSSRYLAWHDESRTGQQIPATITYDNRNIFYEKESLLGCAYLLPTKVQRHIIAKVEAKYSTHADFPEDMTNTRSWDNVEVELKDKTGNTVTATHNGESYEVLLTFSQDKFEIKAQASDWDFGTAIPIPVVDPKKN